MKIARDSNGELVYAYKGIELDKSEYYACPTCGEPVQICQKKKGEYFFRHVTQARHDGETEAHQKGKEELQERLEQQGYRAELERYEAIIGQIPDLTIEVGGKEWVLEYQCSVIPIKEMTSRTKALESLGRSVSWILGKKFVLYSISSTIRELFVLLYGKTMDHSSSSNITPSKKKVSFSGKSM